MTAIDDQAERIKTKIFEAKRKDRRREILHEPATSQAVADFEAMKGRIQFLL